MREIKIEKALRPYRVLDLTEGGCLICGKMLADLGADVVVIEKPGGSLSRVAPFYKNIPDSQKSLFWFAYNANKRGITLDIDSKDGCEIFKDLVKRTDVIVESFHPGYLDSRGLGHRDLSTIKKDLIMTSITFFGQEGPKASYKGCDLIGWASGAMLYMTGEIGMPPVAVSFPQAMLHGGVEAASGTVATIYNREKTGEGQHIDVSIQECVIRTLNNTPPMWPVNKYDPRRGGMSFAAPPFNRMPWGFACKDGYVAILVMGGSHTGIVSSMNNLVKWMAEDGMAPDWLKELDWRDYNASKPIQDLINKVSGAIEKFTLTKTKIEIFKESLKRGILAAPVYTTKDISQEPQLLHRNFWVSVKHEELNDTLIYSGPPVKMSETPLGSSCPRRAPLIGEHNEEIYANELGFSKNRLSLLKQRRVI